MKKRILRSGVAVFLVGIGVVLQLASGVNAISCPKGSLREGEDLSSLSECNIAKDHAGSDNLMETVNIIISVVLGLLGLAAVVMIIYGGFMYVTSAADSAKIKKAKDTITYGVVGLVIAMLAFAIVNYVLANVFK